MGGYTYKIGVSFTGEHRRFVREVCNELINLGFAKSEVFYDDWHQTRITVPNADVLIGKIYHNECRAVVVFLSENYKDKHWTGNIEWRAIRDLINRSKADYICLLRVDGVDISLVDGLSNTRDIAANISDKTPKQTAEFIREWYLIHVLNSPTHMPNSPTAPSESRYTSLIERVYDTLANYRDAVNIGDEDRYHEALSRMDAIMREVYRFAERYSATDEQQSQDCMSIINQYNRFVPVFNEFANVDDRTSATAQAKAREATKEFRLLMSITLDLINAQ